jgi:hypothetical protein
VHGLPVALIGGDNFGSKDDQHPALRERPLRDRSLTLMSDFGQTLTGAPPARISALLKG